jgi:hypothetical protein
VQTHDGDNGHLQPPNASAAFNCFVTLEYVKDPNVQEPAMRLQIVLSMRHSPAFRTLTKTLIINSIKLSATCIFIIILNSGFAIDMHC